MEENNSGKPISARGGVQSLLPLFPQEATLINNVVGVQQRDGVVYYFNGSMPIFRHDKDDLDSFRFITSQLVVNGVCKQVEIVKCFGVTGISVKRWVKRYKESHELGEFVSKKKAQKLPTDR